MYKCHHESARGRWGKRRMNSIIWLKQRYTQLCANVVNQQGHEWY